VKINTYIKWIILSIGTVAVVIVAYDKIPQIVAISKIKTYAQNKGIKPELSVYIKAGVAGVNNKNIHIINAVIAALSQNDVDSVAKIQYLVAGVRKGILPESINYKKFYHRWRADKQYARDDINNIVTDHTTGLQWQDDANVSIVTKQWVADNSDNDSNISRDTAASYCEKLTLGKYTGWRLPSIDEMEYIIDKHRYNPAIDTNVFKNVAVNGYWTSTTVADQQDYAWSVNFRTGKAVLYRKFGTYYVRCVRSGW